MEMKREENKKNERNMGRKNMYLNFVDCVIKYKMN